MNERVANDFRAQWVEWVDRPLPRTSNPDLAIRDLYAELYDYDAAVAGVLTRIASNRRVPRSLRRFMDFDERFEKRARACLAQIPPSYSNEAIEFLDYLDGLHTLLTAAKKALDSMEK